MKATTKARIYRNWYTGRTTKIGCYSYRLNEYTGEIMRCKVGDEDREWIDYNGNRYSAWEGTGEYI